MFKNYEKYLTETDFNNEDQTLAEISDINPPRKEPCMGKFMLMIGGIIDCHVVMLRFDGPRTSAAKEFLV